LGRTHTTTLVWVEGDVAGGWSFIRSGPEAEDEVDLQVLERDTAFRNRVQVQLGLLDDKILSWDGVTRGNVGKDERLVVNHFGSGKMRTDVL